MAIRAKQQQAPGSHMQDFAALRTMMVDTQVRPQDVTKFNIIEAMLTVAREAYVPEALRDVAYVGDNITLDGGRVMLEPRTQGKVLDALDVQPDELVLDLGCGLGYSAALLAHLAEAVVAVEEDEALATEAQTILSEQGIDNVAVIAGALAEGSAKHGPYDVICIEGGVETIPAALIEQLKEGGRMAAIFMDGALGECRIGHKLDGKMHWRMAFNATAPVVSGFEKEAGFVL
jgi:protein-L-isoaspartate(D-aspartate) O-methyltransferase